MSTSRIGTLHLRYRSRGGTLAAAMAPHLDRLISSRLGDAIDARLATMLGDAPDVIVIRELNARVAVGRADWSLDSRFVDRVGAASAEAVVDTLSRPRSTDEVVRFADQAEFVGSFIVDLLAGAAWDRWYYGAFRRYRDVDTAATIAAVLADNRTYAAAVFGWLARRGRLDQVIALLGSERARSLAASEHESGDPAANDHDLQPLTAAAFLLVGALGWPIVEEERGRIAAAYLATTPLPPTWTDRRSLTAWILSFVQFVLRTMPPRDSNAAERADADVRALLHGALDWLDSDWLAPQLHRAADSSGETTPSASSARRVLTGGHERALDRLAEIVRRGGVRLDDVRDRHQLSVRLLALLADATGGAGGPDRGLIAAVDRIADAFCAASASAIDAQRIGIALARGATTPGALPPGQQPLAARLDQVRTAGPAAAAVLQQLMKTTTAPESAGVATTLGGLFLLTRSLLDVRLHAQARDAGVPFELLRAALAATWFDRQPPFDDGAAIWIGRDDLRSEDLNLATDRLALLRNALFERLHDQRAVEAMPGGDPLSSIGAMLVRAWARWLPGIAESSPAFVTRNCLARSARVVSSPTEIAVHLDPAPLDVVVEMAGYFKPIERVPWMNNRTICFTVRRSARM